MSRITAADVKVVLNTTDANGARHVQATVQGRNRVFAVDYFQRWGNEWLCTCGKAPACTHIRATKEAVNG